MHLDRVLLSSWAEPERWEWFASGDPRVAPRVVLAFHHKNSTRQIMFETAILFLVPFALAAAIGIVLRP
jgi:hypothetical protein